MTKIMALLFLSMLSFILSQQCIAGKNCLYNQGICVGTKCECLDGYRTLLNPKLPESEQIFCNYRQKHHLIALALEVFLPGIGHFYAGHYWLGLIKLVLFLGFIWPSYYVYKELREVNDTSYFKAIEKIITDNIYKDTPMDFGRYFNYLDISRLLFNLTFYPFWIFWLVDIFLFFTKTYNDGNGVELF